MDLTGPGCRQANSSARRVDSFQTETNLLRPLGRQACVFVNFRTVPLGGSWRRQPFLSAWVLKPSGGLGAVASSAGLQFGQGIPAPPQVQACSPSLGLSGWFSHTQPQSWQIAHSIQRPIPVSELGICDGCRSPRAHMPHFRAVQSR
jgi:hypothetical protein